MSWWRSLSFIHEARFTGLFSLLWIAKTPLKVCDTSISMISFYKLTFLVWLWFHFIISSYARYGDCWLRLRYFKLYKVKRQLIEIVKTWQTFPFLKRALTVLLQICRDLQNLTKLDLQWRKTKNKLNKVGSRAVCFETLKVLSTWLILFGKVRKC